LRGFAEHISERLQRTKDVDFILALDAHTIAYLETPLPIIYYWDCTFLGNLEYPWFSNLSTSCIENGHDMERRALHAATKACFSSQWAIDSAFAGYGVAADKLRLVPLAANLACRRSEVDIQHLISGRPKDRIELLFIGIDWHRKGGDLALEVAQELNRRGLPTRLTVVGCSPIVSGALPGFVDVRGFLSKEDERQRRELEDLIARSHFLIVPSVAEAFGTVFCEAASFGTPSLARRVGGIQSAVADGVTGKLFDPDAGCSAYCDYVENTWCDHENYARLALGCFRYFDRNLTWSAAARKLLDCAYEALPKERDR
jgi:glycosyltransferase involved in cell wall biosynthesis